MGRAKGGACVRACGHAGMCSEPSRCLRDAVRCRIRRGSARTVAARYQAESRVRQPQRKNALPLPPLTPTLLSSLLPCDKPPELKAQVAEVDELDECISDGGSHECGIVLIERLAYKKTVPVTNQQGGWRGGPPDQRLRRGFPPASAVECLLEETQGKESHSARRGTVYLRDPAGNQIKQIL